MVSISFSDEKPKRRGTIKKSQTKNKTNKTKKTNKTNTTSNDDNENGFVSNFATAVLALHGRKEALILKRTRPLWDQNVGKSRKLAEENLQRRAVTFHSVDVREYGVEIGDNPAVSIGPPLAIDWLYMPKGSESVDQYENKRRSKRRSKKVGLGWNYYQRYAILEKAGFSKKEIRDAEQSANRSRKQRKASAFWFPIASKFD